MAFFPSLLILAALALATAAGSQVRYPESRRVEHIDAYHGTKIADPYRWLEDANSAETAEWVKAQNEVTFAYLKGLPDRERIRERLGKLWNYARYGIPFKEGGRYFYYKNDGLQNQDVLYVQDALDAQPRVLLDPNTLSKDGTVAVSSYSVSPDGKSLAYATSSGGSDWQEFHVRDVETASDLGDHLRWVKFSGAAWLKDGSGFFYGRYPEPREGELLQQVNKHQKLYLHRIGEPQAEDTLIYERQDEPDWSFRPHVTDDGRYTTITIGKGTEPKERVYYFPLDPNAQHRTPNASVTKLIDDFRAAFDFVGNDGPVFYFRTDLDAPKYRVIAIDTRQPEEAHWRTVVPEAADTLQAVSYVGGRFIAQYLHNAAGDVRVYSATGQIVRRVPLPSLGSVAGFHGRQADGEVFYSFTNFLQPTTIYRYDIATGESTLFRKPDMAFDASPYESKQVWYTSKDGTRVPMFLVHRRELKRDGKNPVMLYGYGGFNLSMTPGFSVSRIAWLEAGGVYAVPNLRGGGEFGKEWHLAGTKERKQNVFDDFVAAAEYLIRNKYTSPAHLAISGGSNGGLLVGAAMTQRPELFACAEPAVGVMDMLRFHKFTIGWAWTSDYGSSDDPAQFKTLLAYSPLHNLKPGTRYPATLITTGDHDDRVVPAHSFKFAAALQAAQAGDKPALIRIETRAGHGAGKPTAKQIEEAADLWSFALFHTR